MALEAKDKNIRNMATRGRGSAREGLGEPGYQETRQSPESCKVHSGGGREREQISLNGFSQPLVNLQCSQNNTCLRWPEVIRPPSLAAHHTAQSLALSSHGVTSCCAGT